MHSDARSPNASSCRFGVAMAIRLVEEVAKRVNHVLPGGVRVYVPPGTSEFAIYSRDDWWGTQGLALDPATRSATEVAEQLEVALNGIQDMVVHAINGAWPDLEAGELPPCWATAADNELRFGFGQAIVLPPIPLAALEQVE